MHFWDLKLAKPFRQEKICRSLIRISSSLFCIISGAGPFLYRYCASLAPGLSRFGAAWGWKMRGRRRYKDNILPEQKIARKGKTVFLFLLARVSSLVAKFLLRDHFVVEF